MRDDARGIALIIAALFVVVLVMSCNAKLCADKAGHLAFSFLNSAGYACLDSSDRLIPLP